MPAHYHHCEVCKVPVANCSDDACQGEGHPNNGKHYCSVHHPDPQFRVEQQPPPPRYAVLVKSESDK